jgi:heptosyltransferase-3
MSRTIVIMHPGGFGDLLLAVPAIRRLRSRFARHQILLCGHDQVSEFIHACRLVDYWTSVQASACAGLFDGSEPSEPLLNEWLSRCDLAVVWTKDEFGRLAAALKNSGAGTVVVQSPFSSTLTALHQSDRFLETLQEPAAEDQAIKPLYVPALIKDRASTAIDEYHLPLARPLVLIHPGSGSKHKCVDPAVLASVIQLLQTQGAVPLILEGPADQEAVGKLLSQLSNKPPVLRGLSLSHLAGVLSRIELFLGQDSGVTHLSALLGVPTVALFGPTSPARWAPRGPHVVVVQGEPCHCLSWNEVTRCAEKPCLQLSPQVILGACKVKELSA